MEIKKLVTKMPGTSEQISTILTTKIGVLSLDTTTFPDLNNFAPEYWKYHCPYGNPGDEIHLSEDWRISKICQTIDGFTMEIEFKDGTIIPYQSSVSSPLTGKDMFNTGSATTPDYAIRCKVVITDITVSENQWLVSVALIEE